MSVSSSLYLTTTTVLRRVVLTGVSGDRVEWQERPHLVGFSLYDVVGSR